MGCCVPNAKCNYLTSMMASLTCHPMPVGVQFAPYAGLDDPIIEIAITPNRADCLGVRGVARDLAAAGFGTLKPLDTTPHQGSLTARCAGSWILTERTIYVRQSLALLLIMLSIRQPGMDGAASDSRWPASD